MTIFNIVSWFMPTPVVTSVSIDSFEVAVSGKVVEYLAKYEKNGDGKLDESDFTNLQQYERKHAVANAYLKAMKWAGFPLSNWSDTDLIFTALVKKSVDKIYNELRENEIIEGYPLHQFKVSMVNYGFKVWLVGMKFQFVKLPWNLGPIPVLSNVPPEFNSAISDIIRKGAYIYYYTSAS